MSSRSPAAESNSSKSESSNVLRASVASCDAERLIEQSQVDSGDTGPRFDDDSNDESGIITDFKPLSPVILRNGIAFESGDTHSLRDPDSQEIFRVRPMRIILHTSFTIIHDSSSEMDQRPIGEVEAHLEEGMNSTSDQHDEVESFLTDLQRSPWWKTQIDEIANQTTTKWKARSASESESESGSTSTPHHFHDEHGIETVIFINDFAQVLISQFLEKYHSTAEVERPHLSIVLSHMDLLNHDDGDELVGMGYSDQPKVIFPITRDRIYALRRRKNTEGVLTAGSEMS